MAFTLIDLARIQFETPRDSLRVLQVLAAVCVASLSAMLAEKLQRTHPGHIVRTKSYSLVFDRPLRIKHQPADWRPGRCSIT